MRAYLAASLFWISVGSTASNAALAQTHQGLGSEQMQEALEAQMESLNVLLGPAIYATEVTKTCLAKFSSRLTAQQINVLATTRDASMKMATDTMASLIKQVPDTLKNDVGLSLVSYSNGALYMARTTLDTTDLETCTSMVAMILGTP